MNSLVHCTNCSMAISIIIIHYLTSRSNRQYLSNDECLQDKTDRGQDERLSEQLCAPLCTITVHTHILLARYGPKAKRYDTIDITQNIAIRHDTTLISRYSIRCDISCQHYTHISNSYRRLLFS